MHASSHPGGAFSPWEMVDVPGDDRFSRRNILSETSPEIPMPEEQTMENTEMPVNQEESSGDIEEITLITSQWLYMISGWFIEVTM